MSIQSILLDKSIFSLKQANKWITDHGYKLEFNGKKVHETSKKYRYRQREPLKNIRYRIKKISSGVQFIMEYPYEKK